MKDITVVLRNSASQVGGGLPQAARDSLVNTLLSLFLPKINEQFARYGVFRSLGMENHVIRGTAVLKGLPLNPITVTCSKVDIADDGSTVVIREASSDMAFVDAVIKDYVIGRPFAIRKRKAREILRQIKQIL